MNLRLSSDFDGALYVRAMCDVPSSEVAANDDGPDTRHSSIVTDLAPGTYYVLVDGGLDRGSGNYLLSASSARIP